MNLKSTLNIMLLLHFLIVTLQVSFAQEKSAASGMIINPESAAYDHPRERYLVSCFGSNAIVAIDKSTLREEIFAEGITKPLGNCILEGVLYVSSQQNLIGFDLVNAEVVFQLHIPCIQHLDGMTTDGDGNLYVIDTGGKIHKVDTETGATACVVSSGLAQSVQDCIFDPYNNRLLAVAWKANAPIQAIDLETYEVSTATTTNFGYFDGITIDPEGRVYVASHQSPGKIIRYNNALTGHEIISTGHDEPAGLDYNAYDHVLAVPNFLGNKVDFIDVQPTGMIDSGKIKNQLLICPNPNQGIFSLMMKNPPAGQAMLLMADSKGESIFSRHFCFLEDQRKTIDFSHLPKGQYFLSLINDDVLYSSTVLIH
ncbi:MAG: T9SS type A sorting domain-containing protein [Bacteroidales bacterium]